jgi:hypothetical protein
MKKRKLLLIGILIWNLNSVFGQVCGTPHPTNPTVYSQEKINPQARGSSSALCIDVFFHIVRNTNGTNAFNTPNLNAIVNDLNEFYSPHNIIINNVGSGFINNTNFVNIDNDTEATNLGQINNRSDAINYYIVQTLWNVNGGFITGTANSIPSNNLVIRSDRVLTSTSAHELGHCLNLLHTHETARGVEAINSSNCSSAGDLVCDTPADPRLGTHNVNVNCEYFGGGGFNPLTNNIMSYSRGYCRDEFTNGQGQRMRNAIYSESILQNITSNSCASISEVNNVCYPQTKIISLTNVGNATTIWTYSNNIQIMSSNNTSATIRALTNNSGTGWVRATLSNGIIFTEEFDIGIPDRNKITIEHTTNTNGDYILLNNIWSILFTYHQDNHKFLGAKWDWKFEPLSPISIMTRGDGNLKHISVSGEGGLIVKTRVYNECGCSLWKDAAFQVKKSSTNPGGLFDGILNKGF